MSNHDANVNQFIKVLESPDFEVARAAARQLREIGPAAAPAVPALIVAMNRGDSELSVEAAVVLGRIGPPASPAIPTIVAQIRSRQTVQASHRTVYASALARMGASALRPLLDLLVDRDPQLRSPAAAGFMVFDANAITPAAIAALVTALCDPIESVRNRARSALLHLGEAGIAALRDAMRRRDTKVRIIAADALISAKRHWREAVQVAAKALKDPDPDVRASAAFALRKDANAAVAELVAALHDEEKRVRAFALSALGELDDETLRPFVPQILPLFGDPASDVRDSAVCTIGRFGAEFQDILHGLVHFLSDPDVFTSAVCELDRLGPAASSALPALQALLADPDAQELYEEIVREAIEDAIQSVQGLTATGSSGP